MHFEGVKRTPQEALRYENILERIKALATEHGFSSVFTPLTLPPNSQESIFEGADMHAVFPGTLLASGMERAVRSDMSVSMLELYAEAGLGRHGQPQKLFQVGTTIREEDGAIREDVELAYAIIGGPNDPLFDAQAIVFAVRAAEVAKLKVDPVKVNSIGCRVCRPLFVRQLLAYYRSKEDQLCASCRNSLKTNPLYLLSCSEQKCVSLREDAPSFLNKLCSQCTGHLQAVLEYLDELKVPYAVSSDCILPDRMFGNRTIFEIRIAGDKGSRIAFGGRADYVIESLSGKGTLAVTGTVRLEPLLGGDISFDAGVRGANTPLFVAHAGELAKKKALSLLENLRREGFRTGEALSRDSLRLQLKAAERDNALLALIVGQREVYDETVILRDIRGGMQETIPTARLSEEIKRRLKQK